jgi:hypothetical protein
MRRNIGTIDQVIRFMLGLALISYVAKGRRDLARWGPGGAGRRPSVRDEHLRALSVVQPTWFHHGRAC